MHKIALLCTLLLLPVLTLGQAEPPKKASVLIVYHSAQGHTKAMAEAVAKGARTIDGAEVRLLAVADAKADDAVAADAIIVGSPVYKAAVAPPVQEFINSWPIKDNAFRDKIGAAFATGGNISGGEELTQTSILHSMLVCQMIIVGGPAPQQPFGAYAITSEDPSAKPDDKKKDELVAEYYLKKGEALGARVAQLAVRFKGIK